MIKVKDTESKKSPAKRNITITDVEIKDGTFVTSDEYGEMLSVTDGLLEKLPEGVSVFDIKISIELPEEEEDEEEIDIDELTPTEESEEEPEQKPAPKTRKKKAE